MTAEYFHPPEPTDDQCDKHAEVWHLGRKFTACSYPQMGGSSGKCWVWKDVDGSECFDVWIWHDGEFPFAEGRRGEQVKPVNLHHCSAQQFINFGNFVDGLG